MFNWPLHTPKTEFAYPFIQGMLDRMVMSYFKYGPVAEAYPKRVNAIKTLEAHLKAYSKTGNKEILIDIANYAMIEFMHPAHPDAHYSPRDTKDSLGRIWHGEINPVQDRNDLKER